ncbi:universal stress protein [Rhizobium aegyptiacum]|uniref:universal stress protein n=1 Tax=Rhizobium aegyptiacum TaxID=1764550 RepID=UPI0007E59AD4|nr:universal stress protein [Rhizobium aegyptiacum]
MKPTIAPAIGRHDVWSEPELKVIQDHANEIIAKTDYVGASIVKERSRDAAFTIVDYAERNKVELIVIGASGKNTVKRFLLGSVSNDVVRKAHCPVTIVH